jgi:hypothetical protein
MDVYFGAGARGFRNIKRGGHLHVGTPSFLRPLPGVAMSRLALVFAFVCCYFNGVAPYSRFILHPLTSKSTVKRHNALLSTLPRVGDLVIAEVDDFVGTVLDPVVQFSVRA